MKIMKVLLQTVPFIHLSFYLCILYQVGLLKGIILSYLLHSAYKWIMLKVFKLEALSDGDLIFMWSDHEDAHNMIGLLTLETFDPVAIREMLIERGIKQFRKLRSRLVYKFFDFWWEEVPVEEAVKRIQIIDNFNYVIKNQQDLIGYTREELAVRFDLDRELPFVFKIVQSPESAPEYKNMLIIKFDHCFTDGLGFISMITALADNYDVKLFPQSMRKQKSWKKTIFAILLIPYYILYICVRNFLILKSGRTPFKSSKPITGTAKTGLSEAMDFLTYSKVSKILGITFNDLMMSVFAASIRKYCKEHFDRIPESVITMTPISDRKIPESLHDIRITNDATGIACNLNLIQDPIKDCKIIHKEYANNVRSLPMVMAIKKLMDLLHRYSPFYLTKFIIKQASQNFDITFSNVAGPLQHLYYAGSRLTEMFPFFTTGFTYAFIAIYSYRGKFRLNITLDNALNLDPNLLLKYLYIELEHIQTVLTDREVLDKDNNNKKKN